ncbi:MAG: isoprenylcysteine carboxylmethyltransferase family protein [Candidatus Bathyarchaeota archaeon]|nr:isoprenylcysteine carboxylmethyltransferase family protein [Candidatus Bathyarchaeota archaeon]
MALLRGFFYATMVALSAFVALPYAVLYLTAALPGLELGGWRYVGLLAFTPGLVLFYLPVLEFGTKGRGTPAPFDAPTHLVVDGVFGWTRNPMYLGAFMVFLGEGLLLASLPLLIVSAAAWVLFHVYVVIREEPKLREKFGAEYTDYVESVPRWLPRPHRRRRPQGD